MSDVSVFEAKHDFDRRGSLPNVNAGAGLRRLANAVPVHLLQIDGEERILFANQAVAETWGSTADELLGRKIRDVVGETTYRKFAEYNRRALDGEVVSYETEFPLPNGATSTFLNTYTPVRGHDGSIEGFIATGTDITSRKGTEESLAFERHKLEAIFHQSPAAMALWRGREMVFELVNPRYQALFRGRTLIGKSFLEALPELANQPFLDYLVQVYETGKPRYGYEVLARHRSSDDGPVEDHYYDFAYVRIEDARNRPYGVYVHAIDVTERVLDRKKVEETADCLSATVEKLTRERDLRERFVATLTHDLRTPLTAAKLSAQVLARRLTDSPSSVRTATKIEEHIDRADAMIRDLLDANRINAGEALPLNFGPCDLREVAEATLADLGTIHGDRFALKEGAPIVGTWDCGGIRRILENLCTNGIKYGSSYGKVEVEIVREPSGVCIHVHNDGPPIPQADREKLFRPFHRTEAALSGGQKGWGLGLTLVKGIAEAHGGSVELESSDEGGTTFCVHLPIEARRTHDGKAPPVDPAGPFSTEAGP
jgi:PAS domain S-box-containing protein